MVYNGYNSEIAEQLITLAGLTPDVTETASSVLQEFKCINAVIFERLTTLQKAVDFQIRYDPVTRTTFYEPRGFIDNSVTLTTGTEIIGLPEWVETTDGMINDLRIDGATTETNITESGTIGTTDGFGTDYIQLTKIPNIVELILDGTQKIGGSKGAVNTDYYVDASNKRVYPQTGSFSTVSAVVNYTWMAPIPVRRKRTESITNYGLFQEVVNLPDITSIPDATERLNKILEKRSEPFTIGKLKVKNSPAEDLSVGELITVVDTISTPNINEQFVITKIKRKYPSGYTEIEVGDKEWKLEDDIIELESRIRRLEELFTRESELINELTDASNSTDYIQHISFKINKGTYSVARSICIADNPTHGLCDEGKVFADEGEDAFDWTVHQDTST